MRSPELPIDDDGAFRGDEWTNSVSDDRHLTLFTMHILWTAAPALKW